MIIKNHQLNFWEDTVFPEIRVFHLTPTNSHAPSICVAVSTKDNFLQLSYQIHPCCWLKLAKQKHSKPERKDFLWENHCLECFFELQGDDKRYFELNFSMGKFFNLYQFDDYRKPNHLPPVWADGELSVTWTNINNILLDGRCYHLGVALDNITNMAISKINPTAILYRDGEPIFYAVQHANPPDFHDKAFWQSLN